MANRLFWLFWHHMSFMVRHSSLAVFGMIVNVCCFWHGMDYRGFFLQDMDHMLFWQDMTDTLY